MKVQQRTSFFYRLVFIGTYNKCTLYDIPQRFKLKHGLWSEIIENVCWFCGVHNWF